MLNYIKNVETNCIISLCCRKQENVKKGDLINLLKDIPDDAEIVVNGNSCEILGDYSYENNFTIEETTAHKLDRGEDYQATFSNYANFPHTKVKVWLLR